MPPGKRARKTSPQGPAKPEPFEPAAVDIANKFAVNDMVPDVRRRAYKKQLLFASMLVAIGLVISALSLTQIGARNPEQMAQATPPLQSTPGAETKPSAPAAPAEPTTTGTRPSGVRPEPARPDTDAQKADSQPALPPAPAEKTAPPIKDK
jgi:hypothetical protein